jgi:hypothetical protein
LSPPDRLKVANTLEADVTGGPVPIDRAVKVAMTSARSRRRVRRHRAAKYIESVAAVANLNHYLPAFIATLNQSTGKTCDRSAAAITRE